MYVRTCTRLCVREVSSRTDEVGACVFEAWIHVCSRSTLHWGQSRCWTGNPYQFERLTLVRLKARNDSIHGTSHSRHALTYSSKNSREDTKKNCLRIRLYLFDDDRDWTTKKLYSIRIIDSRSVKDYISLFIGFIRSMVIGKNIRIVWENVETFELYFYNTTMSLIFMMKLCRYSGGST